jgi:limonene-1,2-epoxide hydrolase
MSDLTESEAANSRLIWDFITGWMAPGFDVEKHYSDYLAPDCVHRMSEEHAPLTSAAAAIQAMKDFAASGGAVTQAEIKEIYARGPLVINIRDDKVVIPGQGEVPFKIAAVFVVKDGKIAEWNEYFM